MCDLRSRGIGRIGALFDRIEQAVLNVEPERSREPARIRSGKRVLMGRARANNQSPLTERLRHRSQRLLRGLLPFRDPSGHLIRVASRSYQQTQARERVSLRHEYATSDAHRFS